MVKRRMHDVIHPCKPSTTLSQTAALTAALLSLTMTLPIRYTHNTALISALQYPDYPKDGFSWFNLNHNIGMGLSTASSN